MSWKVLWQLIAIPLNGFSGATAVASCSLKANLTVCASWGGIIRAVNDIETDFSLILLIYSVVYIYKRQLRVVCTLESEYYTMLQGLLVFWDACRLEGCNWKCNWKCITNAGTLAWLASLFGPYRGSTHFFGRLPAAAEIMPERLQSKVEADIGQLLEWGSTLSQRSQHMPYLLHTSCQLLSWFLRPCRLEVCIKNVLVADVFSNTHTLALTHVHCEARSKQTNKYPDAARTYPASDT